MSDNFSVLVFLYNPEGVASAERVRQAASRIFGLACSAIPDPKRFWVWTEGRPDSSEGGTSQHEFAAGILGEVLGTGAYHYGRDVSSEALKLPLMRIPGAPDYLGGRLSQDRPDGGVVLVVRPHFIAGLFPGEQIKPGSIFALRLNYRRGRLTGVSEDIRTH